MSEPKSDEEKIVQEAQDQLSDLNVNSPSKELFLDPDLLTVTGEKLGAGGFAQVFAGTFKFPSNEEPKPVAVKVFLGTETMSLKDVHKILKEEVVAGIRADEHPNLVLTYGYTLKSPVGVCIIMERLPGKTVAEAISEEPFPTLQQRLQWLMDIANGMNALHSMDPPIMHNDLKTQNVLLTDGSSVKVCDFGLAKVKISISNSTGSSSRNRGDLSGTPGFKSPESYFQRATLKSDVYSFGMVIYHLVSGKLPFQGYHPKVIFQFMYKQFELNEDLFPYGLTAELQYTKWEQKNPLAERRPKLVHIKDGTPDALVDLMKECWGDIQEQRPSFGAILERLQKVQLDGEKTVQPDDQNQTEN